MLTQPKELFAPSLHYQQALAAEKPRMPTLLLERLQLLLQLAKNPGSCLIAMENIAAAKELVDTAFHLGAIGAAESRELRMLCAHAQLSVSNAALDRARAAAPIPEPFSDGIRVII
jgi:hypothetical protein